MSIPFDFWDTWWHQRFVEGMATQAGRTAKLQLSVTSVEDRVERMMLINAAIWEMLKDSRGFTDDMLRAKIETVDVRDGDADGRIAKVPITCAKCHRKFG